MRSKTTKNNTTYNYINYEHNYITRSRTHSFLHGLRLFQIQTNKMNKCNDIFNNSLLYSTPITNLKQIFVYTKTVNIEEVIKLFQLTDNYWWFNLISRVKIK